MARTRKPMASSAIFLFALLAIALAMLNAASHRDEKKDEVGSWRVEPDGSISFAHYLEIFRFTLDLDPLPRELLARVGQGIQFALENGAAKEISLYDLYHCHLLYHADRDMAERNPNSVDGILFHAQEWVFYTEEMYKKRNIFVGPSGNPEIVPCQIKRGSGGGVLCAGGSPEGFSWAGPTLGLYFVVVDNIHKKLLQKYKHNIIIVNGHKVLVGHPNFQ